MNNRIFKFKSPIREIKQNDTTKIFESELLDACNTTIESLFEKDSEIENRHVWVYDVKDDLFGILVFDDLGDKLKIQALTNNFAINKNVLNESRPGTSLYQNLQDNVIRMKVKKIHLESIPIRVGYWENLGFLPVGESIEGDFCKLFPMEKKFTF